MAANNGTITLPNPYTPMAFLPPELAIKVTNQTYASIGSLAVLLWDIFLHLNEDYKIATQYRINVLFINYCIARMASLAYVLGIVIITTAPVDNCDYIRQVSILYSFAIPLTAVPFVIRVFALYSNNKYVIAFFSMSWLSVLGGCIAMPIGTIGIKIGTTNYCSLIIQDLPSALSSICPLIHDTLIFVATSWALMGHSYPINMKNGIGVMVWGRNLAPLSKSILRDGQAYYLITLILNVCFVVLLYIPEKAITACTIGIPHFVIDYTITTSAINRALQGAGLSGHQPEGIAFRNPVTLPGMENEGDLEAGEVRRG